jgi:hypothetical protein
LAANEAISLCADVIKNLGYSEKLPKPIVSYAPGRGSLVCTRYSFMWQQPGENVPFASCEMDMETKTIKSIFLKVPALNKAPPKVEAKP